LPNPLHFELVSPERLLLSEEVEQVTVPGSEGDFTVLAGHAPFMSTLRPGVLDIVRGGARERIYVRGGFAEVNAAGLTVLAERAAPLGEMSEADFAEEVVYLQAAVEGAGEDHDRLTAARKRLSDVESWRRWILPA